MIEGSRTHAIVVGIESYGLGDAWNLPGPANDALDCAHWLSTQDVPVNNITLLLSPTSQREGNVLARAATLGFDPSSIQPANAAQVRQTFTDIKSQDGDFLIVFWGGHGIVGALNQRMMICADANESELQYIDLDLEQQHLLSTKTQGFSEQLFLIDACGHYLETLNKSYAITVQVPQGFKRRTSVRQASVYACQIGEGAAQNKADGYGEFSRVVLEHLVAIGGGLPPDMDVVAKKVEEHFNHLREDHASVQRPVYCTVKGFDQESQSYWGSGDAPLGPDHYLTLSQRRRLHASLAGYELLHSRALRDDLVNVVMPDNYPVNRSNDKERDIEHCLVAIEASGCFGNLFEWLQSKRSDASESAKLQTVEFESMYHNMRQATALRRELRALDIRRPNVNRAYLKTVGNPHTAETPDDLAHALELLLDRTCADEHSLLVTFLLRLEHECDGSAKVDASVLERFGVDDVNASSLRQAIAAERRKTSRLIVDFYGTDRTLGSAEWPQSLGAWLEQDDGWSPFHRQSCSSTSDGVRQAFEAIVLWATRATDNDLLIEMVVPRRLFDNNFEAWEIALDPLALPSPVGEENALVLRWGERFHIPDLQRAWRRHCEDVTSSLQQTSAEIQWLGEVDAQDAQSVRALARQVKLSTDTHCLGFEFLLPDAPQDLRFDPVVAALQTGAAYALWFRHGGGNCSELKASAHARLVSSGVENFPAELRTLRAQPQDHEQELASNLVALWDDAGDLPAIHTAREPK